MTPEDLGARLREVRELRGVSLRKAAAESGISAAYLQKLERGDVKSPSPNVLFAVAEYLNVPYSDLMRLAGYVVPKNSAEERTAPESNVLAHALSSEELTEDESRELAKYLTWYRQRDSSSQVK